MLAGRFAAPTSAGVLFSMLAAAGLGATWLFRKARILAIFDDLDTVLLMIPLKMLMVGLAWQLGLTAIVHGYTLWSLHRERQRAPLALWEKLVLVSLAVITVALLVFVLCAAIVLGWSMTWLYEYATTNWG